MSVSAAHSDRIAYGPDDRIRIGSKVYKCVEINDDGLRLERHDNKELFECFTHNQMRAIEQSSDYQYDKDWFSSQSEWAREISGVNSFADIPASEQPEILWKYEYCNRFRLARFNKKAKASNEKMEQFIIDASIQINKLDCSQIILKTNENRDPSKPIPLKKDGTLRKIRSGTIIAHRTAPSYRSLQRWIKLLEKGGWALQCLRKGYRNCGNPAPKLEAEALVLVNEHAKKYATQARPTKAILYDGLDDAIKSANIERAISGYHPLILPSRRRFYYEIASLDQFWVYARRHTLAAAKKKFAGVENGPRATRIGELVEMDEWKVSLMTLLIRSNMWKQLSKETKKEVRKARYWLYVAIDRATRCILAMRLAKKPCAAEAIATVQMVFRDKTTLSDDAGSLSCWFHTTGIGTLSTDWGSAFAARETCRVVRGTGATYHHPPAGHPHLRGTVERLFGTFETRLMPNFASRAFSNAQQRGEYNASAAGNIPLDVLARTLVRHVVDDYHNRPHDGLDGETPNNAWIRLSRLTGRLPLPDKHRQRAIFGIESTCTLDNSGIVFENIRYQSRELFEWFTYRGPTEVRVRVDPEDVGCASVLLDDDWVTVPCRNKDLHGVSLRVYRELRADLKARFAQQAEISRPVVLAAVKDIAAIARQSQAEAGISEELDTPEALRRARESLSMGFELPNWDDDYECAERDLLDDIISVNTSDFDDPPIETDIALNNNNSSSASWQISGRDESLK